jgi:uncharacterized SAM-binding protein YcdF (DUF218 family)
MRHVGKMLPTLTSLLAIPPLNLLLLAALALWAAGRRPAAGRAVAAACVTGMLLLALPAVSMRLLRSLETGWPADPSALAAKPAAIVILGGDVGPGAPVGDIGPLTLQRLRAGAALQRASGLPVLVTGGLVGAVPVPLAMLMARSLVQDFSVPVRWVEPQAADTWQNAELSAAMLKRDGIASVFVVTHPWHMRRALLAFAAAGLVAVPAPLPLDPPPALAIGTFVPRIAAWQASYYAVHEWLGVAWYARRLARGP